MRVARVVAVALIVSVGGAVAGPEPELNPPAPAVKPALEPRANISRVEHKPAGDAPTLGPARAPVTIDLFFIAGAPTIKVPFELLRRLQEAHPSRIRIVYRLLRRGNSLLTPLAAAEAHAQGKFFEFMALVLKKPNQRREGILELARQAGLDIRRLEAAWEDGRHEATLDANEARRQRLHAARNPPPAATFNGVVTARGIIGTDYDTLEGEYLDAYDRALDMLDRGVPEAHLGEAFDRVAVARRPDQVFAPGPIDDPDPSEPLDAPPALVKTPIDTRGWPSMGAAGAEVPILVLCNLRSPACRKQIVNVVLKMRDLFGDQVRVVWGPMFDPAADDAAATTLINDAALCAEELGAGWSWVEQALNVTYRRHGGPGDPDKEIDAVIAATELDRGAVARCQASSAGASARVVARLRAAGVRSGPSLVVGGRIYPGGLGDARMLQAVVEDELAPGILEALVPDWTAR
jgi:hypothetical protein